MFLPKWDAPLLKSRKKRHYRHLLALACLETNIPIDPNLRIKIEDCVKSLIPPRNKEEVYAVSKAGDAIIPLLKYDSNLSVSEAILCIEVLVRIGSPAAMQLLAEYVQGKISPAKLKDSNFIWLIERDSKFILTLEEDFSSSALIIGNYDIFNSNESQYRNSFEILYLARVLGQGYDTFEQENYIRQVLKYTAFLNLSRTQVSDLSSLSSLTQLQYLNLSRTQISDLSSLSSLTQLQYLNLSGTQISDLSSLSSLTQLQYLNLSRTQVSDLSLLSSLTQLQYLNLSETQISDLSPLSSLTQIWGLHLESIKSKDFTPLVKLTQNILLILSDSQKEIVEPLQNLENWKIHFVEVNPQLNLVVGEKL
jgi:Leucine Rich repeats (2 copies)